MKEINCQTHLNDYPEPNLEPPEEIEKIDRCFMCGIEEDLSRYSGKFICPDCAYELYRINKGGKYY